MYDDQGSLVHTFGGNTDICKEFVFWNGKLATWGKDSFLRFHDLEDSVYNTSFDKKQDKSTASFDSQLFLLDKSFETPQTWDSQAEMEAWEEEVMNLTQKYPTVRLEKIDRDGKNVQLSLQNDAAAYLRLGITFPGTYPKDPSVLPTFEVLKSSVMSMAQKSWVSTMLSRVARDQRDRATTGCLEACLLWVLNQEKSSPTNSSISSSLMSVKSLYRLKQREPLVGSFNSAISLSSSTKIEVDSGESSDENHFFGEVN
jgi:hypothetical protein